MSDPLTVGDTAPDIRLPATGDQELSLADFRGQPVVLYFYPKDSTPGCTSESKDFTRLYDDFRNAGAVILGCSRDGIRSHENFRAKHDMPFDLLSDGDEALCNAFGVLKEKTMFGKKVMGIERSTFLIDAEGTIRREWRKVKVDGHAEAVLEALQAL
ncbi:peroxiredoxin [Thiohalospira sp.]|uniref:peroxiredoxin n=1 Tax=Thiohalospira sp. TaxID=3080549 RepID=UPI003980CA51